METVLKSKVQSKILLNIIFVGLALALPQMFHLFGMTGPVFLPMHIPVILAGFTLGSVYGLLAGALSPIISTFLTGMPVAFPMLPIMVLELSTYGLVSGMLTKYTKIPIILKLIITMLAGRVSYFAAYSVIKAFFLPTIAVDLSVTQAFVTGLPGIILQLVLITFMIRRFNSAKQTDK